MKRLRHLCAAIIAATAMLPPPVIAQAQPQPGCKLERFAALPMTTMPDGRFTVPALIGDKMLNFMVDTGGAVATISSRQAFNLQLYTTTTESELRGVGGMILNEVARVDNFSLGRMAGSKGIPFYVHPHLAAGAEGTLSPDMMSRFDADIDIAGGTLSLFSQKHCPGQVVYWTKTGYVVLPMALNGSGHIQVPLSVDGKKVEAILDTGAMTSVISMRAARALGITEKSPELTPVTDKSLKYRLYSYPFKALDFDGITVSNPQLLVASDNFLPGRTEMIIGIGILRQLHLYVAYGEEKLYITPALAR